MNNSTPYLPLRLQKFETSRCSLLPFACSYAHGDCFPLMRRSDCESVKNSNGLPRVKTSVSSKSLPPGFHKGTNDTKPVQIPRRGFLSSIPLASPPLRRSSSKPDASSGRVTGIDTITTSAEEDSLAFTPSPRKSIHETKKCINFFERDERYKNQSTLTDAMRH